MEMIDLQTCFDGFADFSHYCRLFLLMDLQTFSGGIAGLTTINGCNL